MTEAQPADLEQVRYAFRLGWVVAELRGRYRPDLFDTREPGDTGSFRREEYELPLSNERSLTEIRIELLGAAEDLSSALQLDRRDEHANSILGQIKPLLDQMMEKNADREQIWTGKPYETCLAYKFFKWDAQIQDNLVLQATQAAAYQLGRGLADTYWGLYPERPAKRWVHGSSCSAHTAATRCCATPDVSLPTSAHWCWRPSTVRCAPGQPSRPTPTVVTSTTSRPPCSDRDCSGAI